MNKIKSLIIWLSIFVAIVAVGWLCTSYIVTNDIKFFAINYLFTSILWLVPMVILIIIPVMIGWIVLEVNIKMSKVLKIICRIVLLCLSILIVLNISFNRAGYKKYTLNNNRISGGGLVLRTLSDVISRETFEIKTNKVRLISEQRRTRRSTVYDWYLEINNGEYVIPTEHEYKVRKLLYETTYGERDINTICVYKNSKFIKAINGVELSEDIDKINDFADKKEYRINIKVNEDYSLTYETVGCTLEVFKSNETLVFCVTNEDNRWVVNTGITVNDKLPTNLPNGKYKLCIRNEDKHNKQVSNTISYTKKDGVICEIEVENSK